jgi:hypothetical protein
MNAEVIARIMKAMAHPDLHDLASIAPPPSTDVPKGGSPSTIRRGAVHLWNYLTRTVVSDRVEVMAEELLNGEVESTSDVDETEVPHINWPRRRKMTFLRQAVMEVKASTPGITKFTESNRLVAWHKLNKLLDERGVRPSHKEAFLFTAIEMIFVPSDGELDALQFRNSKAALRRVAQSEVKWYTWAWWWDWDIAQRRSPHPAT